MRRYHCAPTNALGVLLRCLNYYGYPICNSNPAPWLWVRVGYASGSRGIVNVTLYTTCWGFDGRAIDITAVSDFFVAVLTA